MADDQRDTAAVFKTDAVPRADAAIDPAGPRARRAPVPEAFRGADLYAHHDPGWMASGGVSGGMWDKIGYHATAVSSLDSILRVGLIPVEHGRSSELPSMNEGVEAVYMFSEASDAEYFARHEGLNAIVVADCTDLETEKDPGWSDGTDAWRVRGRVWPELIIGGWLLCGWTSRSGKSGR